MRVDVGDVVGACTEPGTSGEGGLQARGEQHDIIVVRIEAIEIVPSGRSDGP
jgi:hypothetical protein